MWTENNDSINLKKRLIGSSNKMDSSYEDLTELCDQTNRQYWSREEPRIPWRAICLALFLLVVGFGLLSLSVLISFGFIETTQTNNQSLVLLFLGSIMFIPGFYHMRIAFYAYYRYEGFTFDNIPDFD